MVLAKKSIAVDNQMLAQRTTGSARRNMVKGVKGAGFSSAFSSNFQNFAGAATTFQTCSCPRESLKNEETWLLLIAAAVSQKPWLVYAGDAKKSTQIYKNYNEFLGSPCIVSASQVNH